MSSSFSSQKWNFLGVGEGAKPLSFTYILTFGYLCIIGLFDFTISVHMNQKTNTSLIPEMVLGRGRYRYMHVHNQSSGIYFCALIIATRLTSRKLDVIYMSILRIFSYFYTFTYILFQIALLWPEIISNILSVVYEILPAIINYDFQLVQCTTRKELTVCKPKVL